MVTEDKIKQVNELAQEARESGAVVFSDYSGLTVAEMTELRRKFAEMGADLRVAKNTLLGRALEEAGLKDGELEGPTAVLFSRAADPIESVKLLVSYLKEKAKGAVKFGFFSTQDGSAEASREGGEKTFMTAEGLSELALLPGKAVLQARLAAQLAAPVYKLAYLLSSQTQRLATVLSQVSNSKGGEE